jgi:hypothetical protein
LFRETEIVQQIGAGFLTIGIRRRTSRGCFTDGFTPFQHSGIHHFDMFHSVRWLRLTLVLFINLFRFQIRQPRFAKVQTSIAVAAQSHRVNVSLRSFIQVYGTYKVRVNTHKAVVAEQSEHKKTRHRVKYRRVGRGRGSKT